MASLQELENALRKADKAGNAEDARRLAAAIRAKRGEGAPEQSRSVLDRAHGLMQTVGEGIVGGYGDELGAGAEAALGYNPQTGGYFDYSEPLGERYERSYDVRERSREDFAERNPVIAPVAEIGGALATGTGAARAGLTRAGRAASTAGKVGAGALEGMGYGALYGSGKAAPGERLGGAATGAATGAAAGGALNYAGSKITDALARRATAKAAPSKDMLKRGADAAYDAARARNPQFRGFDRFAREARETLVNEGFHPRLHRNLRVVLDEIESLGPNPDFKTLEKVRQMARASAGNFNNPSEQRLGKMLIDGLDTFVERTAPMPEVKIGRELYGRFKRADMIDKAIEKATRRAASTGSGGNIENALRQEIRKILDNPKKLAGFGQAEREAMERFVAGNRGQDLLRLGGKLSPSGSGLMAALTGVGGAGAAGMSGNPLFLGPALGGMAAKSMADTGARRGSNYVQALARTGGQTMPPPAAALTAEQRALLARVLAGYGGGQAGAMAPMPLP